MASGFDSHWKGMRNGRMTEQVAAGGMDAAMDPLTRYLGPGAQKICNASRKREGGSPTSQGRCGMSVFLVESRAQCEREK